MIVLLCGCAERRYDRPWDIPAVRSIVREYGEPAAISQSSGDIAIMVKWEDRTRLDPRWLDPMIDLYYFDSRRIVRTNGARWWTQKMQDEQAGSLKKLMQLPK
ncbi:MAG: hypothetical protein U0640_00960 [Phycisphaerales bacterium]